MHHSALSTHLLFWLTDISLYFEQCSRQWPISYPSKAHKLGKCMFHPWLPMKCTWCNFWYLFHWLYFHQQARNRDLIPLKQHEQPLINMHCTDKAKMQRICLLFRHPACSWSCPYSCWICLWNFSTRKYTLSGVSFIAQIYIELRGRTCLWLQAS